MAKMGKGVNVAGRKEEMLEGIGNKQWNEQKPQVKNCTYQMMSQISVS